LIVYRNGSIIGAPETGGASLEGLPEAWASAGEAGLGAEATGAGSTILDTLGNLAKNPIGTGLGALGIGQAGQEIAGGVGKLLGIGGQTLPTEETTVNNNQGSQVTPQEIQTALNTSNQITQAVTGIGNQTQAGMRMMQTPEGQQGVQTIGQYGYTPDIDENGRMDWTGGIESAKDKGLEMNSDENKILDAEGANGDIDEVAKVAKQRVRNKLSSTEWDEADKQIDADIQSYKDKFGGGGSVMPLGSKGIGKVRSEGYKSYDRNASTAKNAARRALGDAANAHILDKTQHKQLIAGLHKEKQKLIHAQDVMEFLNGKKAPPVKGITPSLLKHYGKYIGTVLGDKIGGGLGAVIGTMVGDHLVRAVDKKFGKSEFESPALQKGLSILKQRNPQVYNTVKYELAKYEIKIKELKRKQATGEGLLPEPAIRMNAAHQSQEPKMETPTAKAISIKVPKTGKFGKAFTSEVSKNQPTVKNSQSVRKGK